MTARIKRPLESRIFESSGRRPDLHVHSRRESTSRGNRAVVDRAYKGSV